MFAELSSKWFAINPLEKAEEPAPPQPKPQLFAPKQEQPTTSAAPAPSPFATTSAAPAPSPFATTNAPAPSPFSTTSFTTEAKPPVDTGAKDYHKLLTEFYQKHNPEKVSEVAKNLVKYKGKEPDMFAKLAKKYNTTNPLDVNEAPAPAPTSSSGGFGFGNMGSSKSPFGGSGGGNQSPFTSTAPDAAPVSSTSTTAPTSNTSFGVGGGDNKSPFGAFGTASTQAPSKSPFNSTSGSAFGGNTFGAAPSPFGGSSIGSAFGSSSAPAAASTPFSSSTFGSTSGSGFGQPPAAAPPSSTKFGGRGPRDILTQFYQTHNPSKVGEVDKLLNKYAGKEEQLFVNLAKKYNLDPAQFGVNVNVSQPASSTGAAAFGSPAPMGFGASAPVAGGFGGGTFGASSGFGSVPQTGGFSSLAGSSGGFGAFGGAAQTNASPFGATTPFGSARR